MSRERVALIWCDDGKVGSGYAVGTRLILTARHVICGCEQAEVWLATTRKWIRASRAWESTDPAVDAAILRLEAAEAGEDPTLARIERPVQFGRYSRERDVGWECTGFPKAVAKGGTRESFGAKGIVFRTGGMTQDLLQLSLGYGGPKEAGDWAGASGAAVLAEGRVIGVLPVVPTRVEGTLWAIPIERVLLLLPAELRNTLGASGGLPSVPAIAALRPLPSQTSIRRFREEYLFADPGAPPVPFGGRDGEMAELSAWLEKKEAPPRFLITAPAGRGKSALLVRWLEHLRQQGLTTEAGSPRENRWQTVFLPISIRFGTHLPEKYLQALAERLALVAGTRLQPPAVDPVGFYTDQVQDLLQALDETGARVLVVVDGLDEALRSEFNPDLFPKRLSGNVRIVVSARLLLGDVDSNGWRDRLQWRPIQLCAFRDIEPLDVSGIREVLEKMGASVAELAHGVGIVSRLAELTRGDPLLVRYYAEDLWGLTREVGSRVTRKDLETIRPGFGAYFDRWLELQEAAWKEAGDLVDREAVDAVLMALSFAHGPLEATDLVEVLRHLPRAHGVRHIQRVLKLLRRFVIGSGRRDRGYVLAHPRIGEHLQRERFAAEAPSAKDAFVRWGRQTTARVNDDPGECERVPSYLVQFYRRHLEDADVQRANVLLEDFMALVEDGWRKSWEHYEGSQRGFAGDVGAALSRARRRGPLSELPAQLRCVLTLSSIRSVGRNVPSELLLHAVKAGVLTVHQAEDLVRFMGEARDRALTIARLAEELVRSPLARSGLMDEALTVAQTIDSESSRASALTALAPHLPLEHLSQALTAAQAIGDEYARASALSALAPHLPPEQRAPIVSDALAAARSIGSEFARGSVLSTLASHLLPEQLSEALTAALAIGDAFARASALSDLAPHLPAERRAQVLSESLTAARAIGDAFTRVLTLGELVPHLAIEQRAQVLSEALDVARAIGDESSRASALSNLAPHLPAVRRAQVLSEALVAARAIDSEIGRASALSDLAPHLPAKQRAQVLSEALTVAQAIGDDFRRANALGLVAPHLPPEQRARVLSEELTAARAIGGQYARASALSTVAPRLPPEQRAEVLREALTAARIIGDESHRADTLSVLAAHLPPEQRAQILSEALTAAQSVGSESDRASALCALAPHLPSEQLSRALTAAQAIGAEYYRAAALSALAAHLPPEQRAQGLSGALSAARTIDYGPARAEKLGTLARHLAPEQRAQVSSEALTAALAIDDESDRASALRTLAPHLPLKQLSQALTAAQAIGDGVSRVFTLSVLVPHLPSEQRAQVLSDTLSAAQAIGEESTRLFVLSVLAPHLPSEQRAQVLSEALTVARAIGEDSSRASALSALAAHLPAHRRAQALGEALTAAQAIDDESNRASALGDLAPHLLPEQLSQALTASLAISEDFPRASALSALAPHLSPEPLSQALVAVLETSDRFARPLLLSVLKPFAAAIRTSGGDTAVGALRRAILDTATWYP